MGWLDSLHSFGITSLIQIAVLAVAYYYIIRFFRGTRGAQILVGLVLFVTVLIALTHFLNLDVLSWILRRFTVFLGVALLVIFQPEIRRALAELGKQPAFVVGGDHRTTIDHIVEAVEMLSEQKIGALVAIEREIGTRAVEETGTVVDAAVTPELLASIFYPHTPLHDGGVVIRGNRIVAAGCVFPLSQNEELHRSVGTRHRAGLGLSEETDAVAIVVSEETGTVSVCYRGRLSRGLDGERLRRFLSALLRRPTHAARWKRAQASLDLTPEGIAEADLLAGREANHEG